MPQRVVTTAVASVALVLLTWHPVAQVAEGGLDPSWNAALHMAAHGDWVWGRDLVFTYGPLGWLQSNRFWYADTGVGALVYLLVARLALAAALWVAVRRWAGWLLGLLLLLPVLAIVTDPAAALGFAGAVALVNGPRAARRDALLALGLGALAGFHLLVKINGGVTIAVVGGIAVALAGGGTGATLRRSAAWAVALAGAFLLSPLLFGEPMVALPDYLRNAARVVSGYSQIMGFVEPGLEWTFWFAPLTALIGAAGILVLTAHRRGVVLLMWAAWCLLFWKAAYVRQDAGHVFLFFAALAPAVAALPLRPDRRVFGALLTLMAPLAFLSVTEKPLSRLFAPIDNVASARRQIAPLWDRAERDRLLRDGRTLVGKADALPEPLVAPLRGRTVTVMPAELAVVWLYGLDWAPLPVLQSYGAYTPGLDRLNAQALLGPHAPERILYQAGDEIDGRADRFDTPETARARLCRYQPLVTLDPWIVLARDRDRCTAPVLVGSMRAAWGQSVPVPRPSRADALVFARVAGVQVQGWERIRTLLLRSQPRFATLEPGGDRVRLTPGTISDGLPLLAGARADLPPPFNVAAGAESIAITREGHVPAGTVLRYDFYEIRNPGLARLSITSGKFRCAPGFPYCPPPPAG